MRAVAVPSGRPFPPVLSFARSHVAAVALAAYNPELDLEGRAGMAAVAVAAALAGAATAWSRIAVPTGFGCRPMAHRLTCPPSDPEYVVAQFAV